MCNSKSSITRVSINFGLKAREQKSLDQETFFLLGFDLLSDKIPTNSPYRLLKVKDPYLFIII